MAQSFTYDGVALTTVRRSDVELVEKADHGDVGSAQMVLDDEAGTLVIVGHKEVIAEQSSCSVARTFTGYMAVRKYRRGEHYVSGASREIDATLVDLNARLGFKAIRTIGGGNRPRETVQDRLEWLLASSFLSGLVEDFGFVDYPTDIMDENDYRGQFPADVIRDLALRVGFNFFVYWDTDEEAAGLWFRDSNTSEDFTSDLRISNVMADIDADTTFAASQNAELSRDPADVVSGVLVPFARGHTYRTRAATAETYEARDGVAPNATVKRRDRAQDIGDAFLFRRRNEEDFITDTIRLPASKVNLVRAGQRMQAKYSHFATEGYGGFTWFRVLERGVTHPQNDDNSYDVRLVLSPQETTTCSVEPTFVQVKYQDETLTERAPHYTEDFDFDAPTTIGNLVVVGVMSPQLTGAYVIQAPDGWEWPVQNVDSNDTHGTGSYCNVFFKRSAGEDSIPVQFNFPSGARRVVMGEYAGLTDPRLYAAAGFNVEDPGLGNATVPTTSYPAGPALVVGLTFMEDGPQGTDDIFVEVGSANIRNPIDGSLHGVGEVALSDQLHDGSAGSTSWTIGNTSTAPTLSVGLVFVGDNC